MSRQLSRTAAALSLFTASASAQPTSVATRAPAPAGAVAGRSQTDAPESALAVDVELDPIAYVFAGYSVHGGVRAWRLRFDIGAFAIEPPEGLRTNAAIHERFEGFGGKCDYRFGDGRVVPFAGAGVSRVVAHLRENVSGATIDVDQTSLALRAGLEIKLWLGLYLSPWVSLNYTVNQRDHQVGGALHSPSPWTVFPTLHLGFSPEQRRR